MWLGRAGFQKIPLFLRFRHGIGLFDGAGGGREGEAEAGKEEDGDHAGAANAGGAVDDDGFATDEDLFHRFDGLVDLEGLFGHAVVGDFVLPEFGREDAAIDGCEVFGGLFGDLFVGDEAEDVVDPGVFGLPEECFDGLEATGHGGEVEFAGADEGREGDVSEHGREGILDIERLDIGEGLIVERKRVR